MKKSTIFLFILFAFFFVAILVLAYLNYFSSKNPQVTTKVTETVVKTLTPTAVISTVSESKIYSGQDFTYHNNIYSGYNFNYPSTCVLKDETLTCTLKNSAASILINAGGHGGNDGNYRVLVNNQTKIIDSVEGNLTAIEDIDNKVVFGTYWINKTPILTQEPIFGFEFSKISVSDFEEFKILFNDILSSFKFTP
jgi:hypothetical protein